MRNSSVVFLKFLLWSTKIEHFMKQQNILLKVLAYHVLDFDPAGIPNRETNLLPPQTKFAKVMFLHLSVSHSVHRGSTWAGTPPGQVPPRQVHPPGRYTPLGRYPLGSNPLGRYPPTRAGTPQAGTPPRAVHAGRYRQQAGSMHPTGMHSCLFFVSIPGSNKIGPSGLSCFKDMDICHVISCTSCESKGDFV